MALSSAVLFTMVLALLALVALSSADPAPDFPRSAVSYIERARNSSKAERGTDWWDMYQSWAYAYGQQADSEEVFYNFIGANEWINDFNSNYPWLPYGVQCAYTCGWSGSRFNGIPTGGDNCLYTPLYEAEYDVNNLLNPDWNNDVESYSIPWYEFSGVHDQGGCGSCWAFVTMDIMPVYTDGNAYDGMSPMSVQELVDCTNGGTWGNAGCDGGYIVNAVNYVISQGSMTLDSDYNYYGYTGACSRGSYNTYDIDFHIWGYATEDRFAAALAVGPLGAMVDAGTGDWLYYYSTSGSPNILSSPLCSGTYLDHALVITGFSNSWAKRSELSEEERAKVEERGAIEYWITKNSWGTQWGLSGYIYVERGCNMCGIGNNAIYALSGI